MIKQILSLVTITLLFTGCSVYMAAHQPEKVDTDIIAPGLDRTYVISQLGQPASTEKLDGITKDVFLLKNGYSKTTRTMRTAGHAIADVATLGLWEVVGTPSELVFDGDKIRMIVTYDSANIVTNVERIKN